MKVGARCRLVGMGRDFQDMSKRQVYVVMRSMRRSRIPLIRPSACQFDVEAAPVVRFDPPPSSAG